jgi:hypothetical protein
LGPRIIKVIRRYTAWNIEIFQSRAFVMEWKKIRLGSAEYISDTINAQYVRFYILTAASVKMTVFRVDGPCNHVELNRRYRGTYCFHHQGVHEIKRNYDPVDSPLNANVLFFSFYGLHITTCCSSEILLKL